MRTNGRKLAIAWLAVWFGCSAVEGCLRGDLPIDLPRSLAGPAPGHWLGFDAFGRDLLRSELHASLVSAGFALSAVALSCAVALVLGSAIAIAPDRARFGALRALESFLAFPSLLLALAWAAIRGPGWNTLMISLLLGILPPFTRLTYVRAREVLSEPYILAARSMGADSPRIIRRHLIPMLRSLCAVKAPFLFAQALMAEATLSFLGIGAPIGHETWGSLLAAGKDYLFEAPHLALASGIPLMLTVLAFQCLTDSETFLRIEEAQITKL